jgi:hypothetical protein
MKQIGILLEELNKMKNLIHAKAGVVISEQDAMDTDVNTINSEIFSITNTDEQKIVDVLKKYATDKNTFQNFLTKFRSKGGVDLQDQLKYSFSGTDQAEIDDLNSVLSKIGLQINVGNNVVKFEDLAQLRQKNIASNYCSVKGDKIENPKLTFNGRRWVDFVSVNKVTEAEIAAAKATCPTVIVPPAAGAAAGAAETPANAETPAATNLTDRQKTINFEYCNVKNGKIENAKSSSNGITWQNYVSTYKITPEEIAVAKPTCPNVVVPNVGGGQTGPTPTQRFATTATSLGIQNPKMDVATLQTILNTLNQGGSGLTESKNSVNEELNKMKYILGYQRGRVISEQDAAQTQQAATQPAATPKDLIRQIQTVLKTKYNANLGKFGAKGDGIDEKWGNLTQTALENALKTIADVKQRRETETQQTTTQDTAIQQAAEKGRMEIPQTNNLPNLPGIQQKQDIYTTLVNNKTLVTRPNGNIVYKGVDLTSTQRQELETKLKTMGYNLSTDNRDKTYGDKLIFKKNQ